MKTLCIEKYENKMIVFKKSHSKQSEFRATKVFLNQSG